MALVVLFLRKKKKKQRERASGGVCIGLAPIFFRMRGGYTVSQGEMRTPVRRRKWRKSRGGWEITDARDARVPAKDHPCRGTTYPLLPLLFAHAFTHVRTAAAAFLTTNILY